MVQKVVSTFPERYLLCDEVGLGKTLEGGAIIKQLTLSGQARRCLILAPKSVCRQWQEEFYESFLLNVPEYDGATFRDYFQPELHPSAENPWDAFPIVLASSQLVKRRERTPQLLAAKPWDLVLVDEAHHARRKDFLSGRYRRNRLLSLLLGAQDTLASRGLSDRTRGLLLMTATPMQVDAREVWDLLTVLGLGGRWGSSDTVFLRFFREIRNEEAADWTFLLSLVRDHLDYGGEIEPALERVARERVGVVAWATIRGLPFSNKARAEIGQLDAQGKAVLLEFIRRTTPLSRYMFRNTRALLRRYQDKGWLGDRRVPTRRPELQWIPMDPDERRLYERIEEYISEFYRKYEAQRAGLGFVMTVYRRRLTSSFYAVILRKAPPAGSVTRILRKTTCPTTYWRASGLLYRSWLRKRSPTLRTSSRTSGPWAPTARPASSWRIYPSSYRSGRPFWSSRCTPIPWTGSGRSCARSTAAR